MLPSLISAPKAPGISATPHADNLRYFDVVIAGPAQVRARHVCVRSLFGTHLDARAIRLLQSPYEGGLFRLELFLGAEYPMEPPKGKGVKAVFGASQEGGEAVTYNWFPVRFMTRLYHPNVDKLGRICLDILKDKWSPALQIRTVLLSIQALLSAPNPYVFSPGTPKHSLSLSDDPLDNQIADMWKSNLAKAHANAKEFTQRYAK